MTERLTDRGGPFDAGDPPRDAPLGALLREAVGTPPSDEVDWAGLASRIGIAIRASRPTPWWSYAERWQRRAVPLALAAGLIGALTIWSTPSPAPVEVATGAGAADAVSSVLAGGSSADAAGSFTRSIAGAADVGLGAPE